MGIPPECRHIVEVAKTVCSRKFIVIIAGVAVFHRSVCAKLSDEDARLIEPNSQPVDRGANCSGEKTALLGAHAGVELKHFAWQRMPTPTLRPDCSAFLQAQDWGLRSAA